MDDDRRGWRGDRRAFGGLVTGASLSSLAATCRAQGAGSRSPITGDRGPIIIKGGSLEIDYGRRGGWKMKRRGKVYQLRDDMATKSFDVQVYLIDLAQGGDPTRETAKGSAIEVEMSDLEGKETFVVKGTVGTEVVEWGVFSQADEFDNDSDRKYLRYRRSKKDRFFLSKIKVSGGSDVYEKKLDAEQLAILRVAVAQA